MNRHRCAAAWFGRQCHGLIREMRIGTSNTVADEQSKHYILLAAGGSSSSSSANAPKVLQPYWLIVVPLDFPDLTASLLL